MFPPAPAARSSGGHGVLASNRGVLPELVGDAGFLFDIPAQYTPESREVPVAEEIGPCGEAIIRLWDDPQYYDDARRRCRCRAEAWRPDIVLRRYRDLFDELVAGRPEVGGSGG